MSEPRLGAVAIGRNEGQRLVRCLTSLRGAVDHLVYVDSGSTDESVAHARELGCDVVELDLSEPFTAARARNAGLARLLNQARLPRFVQFVDGDCEVVEGWLEAGVAALEDDPRLGVVCGRRRERHPERSVFNRVCDVEWDTPVGLARSCGGDALFRSKALVEVEGFRDDLIAGEEPELCVRLRAAGWRVRRIDAEMTLHDADMTELSQWWRRAERSGHAFAEGAALHGERGHWVQERNRILGWGLGLPAAALGLAPVTLGASLSLLGAYPVQAYRVYRRLREEEERPVEEALPYALSCVLAKLPEAQGALGYYLSRLRGKRRGLIEYKTERAA